MLAQTTTPLGAASFTDCGVQAFARCCPAWTGRQTRPHCLAAEETGRGRRVRIRSASAVLATTRISRRSWKNPRWGACQRTRGQSEERELRRSHASPTASESLLRRASWAPHPASSARRDCGPCRSAPMPSGPEDQAEMARPSVVLPSRGFSRGCLGRSIKAVACELVQVTAAVGVVEGTWRSSRGIRIRRVRVTTERVGRAVSWGRKPSSSERAECPSCGSTARAVGVAWSKGSGTCQFPADSSAVAEVTPHRRRAVSRTIPWTCRGLAQDCDSSFRQSPAPPRGASAGRSWRWPGCCRRRRSCPTRGTRGWW